MAKKNESLICHTFVNDQSNLSVLYYHFTNITFTSTTLMWVPETKPMITAENKPRLSTKQPNFC